jgi:elongation factor P
MAMVQASGLRPGGAIRLEGVLYKVIAAEYHGGGGKMGGVTHAKLLNLATGTVRERRFRGDELVETLAPERQNMQYLYADGDVCYFMHPETFEQVAVEKSRLGRASAYVREGTVLPVEFYDGEAMGIVFPDIIEMRVTDTAPPQHTQGMDNVRKEATLENGMRILVPPFIGPGETIRVEVATGAYMERAKPARR